MPVPTFTPSRRNASQNSSYNFFASSGGAAEMKLGRRCPRASPYSVNCDTTSASPFTSSSEWFIFPCSSSKIRRLLAFSAIAAATAEVSSLPTPSRIISPAPISPVTRPSTVTFARLTLCTTMRIFSLVGVQQCCTPVASVSQPWRASLTSSPASSAATPAIAPRYRQIPPALPRPVSIIPPYAVQRIRLRMMCLVVVRRILHAPEAWHARFIKRHVVRSSLAAQRGFHDSRGFRQGIHNAVNRLPHVVIPHQPNRKHFPGAGVVHQDPGNFGQFILVRRHIRSGAVQALLLAGKQHKPDGALRLHPQFLQCARRFQHRHGSGAIVRSAGSQVPRVQM